MGFNSELYYFDQRQQTLKPFARVLSRSWRQWVSGVEIAEKKPHIAYAVLFPNADTWVCGEPKPSDEFAWRR